MIITESLPFNEIKSQLKKSDEIGIISCNACARMCKTGGPDVLKELSEKLKKENFKIVDADLIGTPCDFNQLNKSQLHGNVQILLACDAGIYNLKKLFPNHKIISGTKTLGLGAHEAGNKITLIDAVKAK